MPSSSLSAAPSAHLRRRAPHLFGISLRPVRTAMGDQYSAACPPYPRSLAVVEAITSSLPTEERTIDITVSIMRLGVDLLCEPINRQSLARHWKDILDKVANLYAEVIPTLPSDDTLSEECQTALSSSLREWVTLKLPAHTERLRNQMGTAKTGSTVRKLVALSDDLQGIVLALYALHQITPENFEDERLIQLFTKIVHAQVSDLEDDSIGDSVVLDRG